MQHFTATYSHLHSLTRISALLSYSISTRKIKSQYTTSQTGPKSRVFDTLTDS